MLTPLQEQLNRPAGNLLRRRFGLRRLTVAACMAEAIAMVSVTLAEEAPKPPAEYVQVTATRIPESVDEVPASVSIVTGDEMRARGVRDLRGALFLMMGIDIAPGGDGGPAASVPEMWGLREFDAFLLVVDGIPWGGAFNPDLASLDLSNVARIEVLRGPAPVMYGATSFVGVIQVIRKAPSESQAGLSAWGGSYGSGGLSGQVRLPKLGALDSSVSADIERRGFSDDRTQFDRGHVLWRGVVPGAGGNWRFDVDGVKLNQDPNSPHPRDSFGLSEAVPIDANHNLEGSHLDGDRWTAAVGYDREFGQGVWTTLLSASRSSQDIVRGFLAEPVETDPNAHGLREDLTITDIYFSSAVEWTKLAKTRIVLGIDNLYGNGDASGGDFDYFVELDGDNAPDESDFANQSDVQIHDERNFAGIFGHVEWLPSPAWRLEAGARLNMTQEDREASAIEFAPGAEEEGGDDSRSETRGSGGAGVTWTPWTKGPDGLHVYANYRNTFKPAAIDFGLEAEGDILEPETSESYELGFKGRFADGKVEVELNGFNMEMENLVVSNIEDGLPGLENAGAARFRGIEADFELRIRHDLFWRVAGSLHDARFLDYVTVFDGVPTQLEGNRFEMSPREMAATGLIYAPDRGFVASAEVKYVGDRYLNKRNTALADSYTTWSAGVGYRFENWEVRVDGVNLNDTRPPVTESELGDSQYYLLPARAITLRGGVRF